MNTSISLRLLAWPLGVTVLTLSAAGCPDFGPDPNRPPLRCDEDAGVDACQPPAPNPVPDECTCTLEYSPVCGEDDKTYGNACQAGCADVEIAHRGECSRGCVCPAIAAPVCGEDGRTYGNSCEARCAGASIDHDGRCEVGSEECTSNRDCGGTEVCHPEARECRPECTISCLRSDPVCGRDGVTYDCGQEDAFCHGAAVAHAGACDSGCVYEGEHYAVGETFATECNRCSCGADGGVSCTAVACNACDYDDPARSWIERSPRECSLIRFTCAPGLQAFSDDCGCGCEAAPATGCKVGGCSSQLCVDASAEDRATTCEWREEYACFRSASCELQGNGRCGWTQTPELQQCLDLWR